ncbi:hypothetical protein DL764_005750 [Monosporascus ibericus]|uniref:Uncharacterized protein n=1 Tax=Monosporascus ibericus TaxID=155417 RepID=A0A4Q4T7Y5_9PEZI|nr:hypothetical protein DL764_005750 [Monosporascus ibericus]
MLVVERNVTTASAGFSPIATGSLSNFDLVLRFGAEKDFDYHSLTCAADLRGYIHKELASAIHCVTHADTTQLCYAALGRAGGRYVALEPFQRAMTQTQPSTVEPSWVLVLTIFGREVTLQGKYGREVSLHGLLESAGSVLSKTCWMAASWRHILSGACLAGGKV